MTRMRSCEGGGSGGRKEQKMALLFFTVTKFIPSVGWRSLGRLQTRERLLIKSSSLSTCGQRSSSNACSSKMNMEPERLFLQSLCWTELESESRIGKCYTWLFLFSFLFLFLFVGVWRKTALSHFHSGLNNYCTSEGSRRILAETARLIAFFSTFRGNISCSVSMFKPVIIKIRGDGRVCHIWISSVWEVLP